MNKKIIILGAGISGLAAAWFLKQKYGSDLDLAILEKSGRVGGWIETLQEEGFLFERGPRSFRSGSMGIGSLRLLKGLSLESQIIPCHLSAQARFIYSQNRLQPVPSGLWKLPFSPLTRDWWRVLGREYFLRSSSIEEETVDGFFRRRLGQDWTELLVDPLVSGIFAGDIRKLSMKSCFPFFYGLEKQHGGILKGLLSNRKKVGQVEPLVKAPFFSFRHGLETLPRALSDRLQEHIRLNCPVRKIAIDNNTFGVEIEGGVTLEADYLISTLPAYQLAYLLDQGYPLLSNDLRQLNYATVHVVSLGYTKPVLKQAGFGYLVPSREKEEILGCVWDSSVFPQQSLDSQMTRLTVMLGGARHPQAADWTSQKVLSLTLKALERQLSLDQPPDFVSTHQTSQAIPQYEIGYDSWLEKVKGQFVDLHPRLLCIGTAFNRGVSISDCIDRAYETLEQIQ